jgi:4-amino-4-deoxy-L-arabinose transferase-like glycosyltransferase
MAQLLESYWNDPTPFYMALRWLSVVCGVATIGVAAALGKTLSGNRTAWLAAGLMATNYLAIRNSHFGTIDSLWTLAIGVALWTMLHWAKHLPQRPVLLTESLATSPKPYAVPKWVLVAVGLAIGVKYPAAVLLVPVWWIACTPLITPSLIHWGALFKTMGQISLVVLGVFLLTSPWTVLDMHQFLADVAYESSYYYTYRLRGIDPGWLFYPNLALWHGVGAGLLACAAWGVWQTRKSIPKPMHVVLLGFGLAYFVLCLGPNVRVMTRYALPLIPVVLVYAALGIEALAQWLGTRLQWTSGRQQSVVAAVLASLLMLPSLSNAVAMDRLLSQPDTRTLARNWILAQVPPEQPIAAGPRYGSLQLPLAYSKLYSDPMREPDPVSIEPWLHHDRLVTTYQYPKMFDDLGIRLVVLFGGMPMFSNTPGEWRNLNQVGKLVAQWVPMVPNLRNPAEAPRPPVFDPMDAMYLPFVNFDAFERPGPQVAIVAVPQTPVSKTNPKAAALAVFGRR